MSPVDNGAGNTRDLIGGFAFAEDHLGEALTGRAMVVDAGEPQVLERIGRLGSQCPLFGFDRIEAAVAYGVEKRAERGRGRERLGILFVHGYRLTPLESAP